MRLTVRETLSLGPLAGARVLAGGRGLDREVEHVTVVDAPDAADWLRGGEFVLTTAYAVRDTREGQVDLIRRLIAVGASALGIKLRRFIDALSDEVLEFAEQAGFPIIEMPYEVAWIDIITPVLGEVLHRQASVLQRSMDIHTQFIQTVLGGGGMQDIAASLGKQIDTAVAVTDMRHTIVASSGSPDQACPGLAAGWAQEVALLASAEDGANVQVGVSFEPWELAPDMSRVRIMVESEPDNPGILPHSLIVASIGSDGFRYGRLLAMEVDGRPFGDMDAIAIGHAVTTATLEALRLKAAEDAERRFRVNFWDDLVHMRFESQADAVKKAESFEVDLTRPSIVMTIAPDPTVRSDDGAALLPESEFVRMQDEIALAVSRFVLSAPNRRLVSFPYRRGVSVILPWSGDKDDVVSPRQEAVRMARELHDCIRAELDPRTVSIGIGRYYKDPVAVAMSYREASQAVALGRIVFGPNSVTHFDSIGAYRVISRCIDQVELKNFARDQLAAIEEYDAGHGTELIATLEAFLGQGCNAQAAADKLYVHVNTLKYRLGRVQRLAGIDLQNPETRFNLELALKIRRYLKATSPV